MAVEGTCDATGLFCLSQGASVAEHSAEVKMLSSREQFIVHFGSQMKQCFEESPRLSYRMSPDAGAAPPVVVSGALPSAAAVAAGCPLLLAN